MLIPQTTTARITLLLSFLLSLLTIGSVFCQSRDIKINEISINNLVVPFDNYENIVLSERDTISFRYDLDHQSRQPFLFNLNLIKDADTSSRTAGFKEVSYSSLSDGEYTFQISAFDLQGT